MFLPVNRKTFLLSAYLAALRPRQWTKNAIVFAAPLFGFSINGPALAGALLALVLFCCASSSFYLINDVIDVESDRHHPVKCKRPIAAGLVSVPSAIALSIVLLVGAVAVGWWRAPLLGIIILSYALLQVCYNLKLKHTAILDIIAIAMGFVLRACAGGAATGILLSPWFLLCTAMLALFLGVEKRKAELRLIQQASEPKKIRPVLWRYSLPLLTRMESTVTTGAVMSYALWSSGPVVQGASTAWMLLTLPFVLYGVFRYQLLSDPEEIARRSEDSEEHGGRTERPEEILLKDMPTLATVLGWLMTTFTILLLQQQGIIH